MKCFLCNFLRYSLLIYTIVATGGTIITKTTTTTSTTTIMTIETLKPMDSYDKKHIKLTKREIDERLQQPFTIMKSIEEEMEPEEDEDENSADPADYDEYDDHDNDEYDDDDDENIKANKKKRKRKRKRRRRKRPERKKRKKHQHVNVSPLGQPANLLLASLTQLPTTPPIHYAHKYKPYRKKITTTTSTPTKLKPLKYILNKGNLIKKKKQEYLSHLGYVFLPFVKFVAFFTVLNPFTLAVFFFMLISPVVFGLLGFTALSFILRPAMNLLFAVKHRIGNINRNNRRRRYRHKQQSKHNNHIAPRPITIHKHFYTQPRPNEHSPLYLRRPTTSPSPSLHPLLYYSHRQYPYLHRADNSKDISFHNSTQQQNRLVNVQQTHQNFNPLLPQLREHLKQVQPPSIGLSTRFILPSL